MTLYNTLQQAFVVNPNNLAGLTGLDTALIAIFFVLLTIVVTLISISSTMATEIRFDLLVKYLLNKGKQYNAYLYFLIASFVLTLTVVWASLTNSLNDSALVLFSITIISIEFAWTLTFINHYFRHLKRSRFYGTVFRHLSRRLAAQGSKPLKRTPPEIIDILQNASYVANRSKGFYQESRIISAVLLILLDHGQLQILNQLFETQASAIGRLSIYADESPQYYQMLIRLLYELRYRAQAVNDPNLARLLQYYLSHVLGKYFDSSSSWDPQLAAAGLYITEFSYFNTEFGEEKNVKRVAQYQTLFEQTSKLLYQLCTYLLDSPHPPELKYRYLTEQLQSFTQFMEMHKPFPDPMKDIDQQISSLRDGVDQEKEDVDVESEKLSVLFRIENTATQFRARLIYRILNSIEQDNLPKKAIELAGDLYSISAVRTEFLGMTRSPDLDFLSFNRILGGGQAVGFNYDKHKGLMILGDYLNNERISSLPSSSRTSDEKYLLESLRGKIEEKGFAKSARTFFEFEDSKFTEFRKKLVKKITDRLNQIDRMTQLKVRDAPVKGDLTQAFKETFVESWNKSFDASAYSINTKKKPTDKAPKESITFGTYSLVNKEWFIESVDGTHFSPKELAAEFARGYSRSKENKCAQLIVEQFGKKKGDKTLVIGDLRTDLENNIDENKEYTVLYNSELNPNDVAGVRWENEGPSRATVSLKGSTISFMPRFGIERSILFEKDSWTLEQFKTGKKYLSIEIRDLTHEEIRDSIERKKGSIQKIEEAKEHQILRITERFRITRTPESRLFKLTFDPSHSE